MGTSASSPAPRAALSGPAPYPGNPTGLYVTVKAARNYDRESTVFTVFDIDVLYVQRAGMTGTDLEATLIAAGHIAQGHPATAAPPGAVDARTAAPPPGPPPQAHGPDVFLRRDQEPAQGEQYGAPGSHLPEWARAGAAAQARPPPATHGGATPAWATGPHASAPPSYPPPAAHVQYPPGRGPPPAGHQMPPHAQAAAHGLVAGHGATTAGSLPPVSKDLDAPDQDMQWKFRVTKRFSEIASLHSKISSLVEPHGIQRPAKTWFRSISQDFIQKRCVAIERYLRASYALPQVVASSAAREFLGISDMSFRQLLGQKNREGYMKRKTGGFKHLSNPTINGWKRRWVVLKDSCILLLESRDVPIPREIIVVDANFRVNVVSQREIEVCDSTRKCTLHCGTYRSACEWLDALRGMYGTHPRVSATMQAPIHSFAPVRMQSTAGWLVDGKAGYAAMAQDIASAKRQIFITGWWVGIDVELIRRRTIPGATSGPGSEPDLSLRLVDLIWRKAFEGVQIYVLLFKEVEMLLKKTNSAGTKRALRLLHEENVHVMRHPTRTLFGNRSALTHYWSHHEKILCVDQRVAYVGGLDMCPGRYDDKNHLLYDHVAAEASRLGAHGPQYELFRGMDYYNPSVAEAETPSQIPAGAPGSGTEDGGFGLVSSIATSVMGAFGGRTSAVPASGRPRLEQPGAAVAGAGGAAGTAPPAPRRSGKALLPEEDDRRAEAETAEAVVVAPTVPGAAPAGAAAAMPGHESRSAATSIVAQPLPPPRSAHPGAGEVVVDEDGAEEAAEAAEDKLPEEIEAPRVDDGEDSAEEEEQAIAAAAAKAATVESRTRIPHPAFHPRMPWHDVHVRLEGTPALDIAWHFIQRWNHHRLVKDEPKQIVLAPYTDLRPWWETDSRGFKPLKPITAGEGVVIPREFVRLLDLDWERDGFASYVKEAITGSSQMCHGCNVHVLRSLSPWSCGVDKESSIMNALIRYIETSTSCIYIETQFFVSETPTSGAENKVMKAILDRVRRAIRDGVRFRVYMILPEHPEGLTSATHVKSIMYFQYATLCRGAHSLMQSIHDEFVGVNVFDYICAFSLRTHGMISGRRTTEQVYVHSKLVIIDDRVVLIGSANLNDRSLLGNRDSEICAVISDGGAEHTTMDGKPFVAGKFAHSLRVRLWREHLGLLDDHDDATVARLADPVCDDTWINLVMRTAIQNSLWYEENFPETKKWTRLSRTAPDAIYSGSGESHVIMPATSPQGRAAVGDSGRSVSAAHLGVSAGTSATRRAVERSMSQTVASAPGVIEEGSGTSASPRAPSLPPLPQPEVLSGTAIADCDSASAPPDPLDGAEEPGDETCAPIAAARAPVASASAAVASAPIASAPAPSAPVPSAPAASAPAASAPAASAPAASAPAASAPAASAPAPSAPIASAPPASAPAAESGGASPDPKGAAPTTSSYPSAAMPVDARPPYPGTHDSRAAYPGETPPGAYSSGGAPAPQGARPFYPAAAAGAPSAAGGGPAAYPGRGAPHPPHGGGYPPQGDGYPPRGGGYPPRWGHYPPHGGQYAPHGRGYPPRGGEYPPRGPHGSGYPPRGPHDSGYPPRGSEYPPRGPPGSAYPARGGEYPPRGGGYPPRASAGYPATGTYPARGHTGHPSGHPAHQYPARGPYPPQHQPHAAQQQYPGHGAAGPRGYPAHGQPHAYPAQYPGGQPAYPHGGQAALGAARGPPADEAPPRGHPGESVSSVRDWGRTAEPRGHLVWYPFGYHIDSPGELQPPMGTEWIAGQVLR